MRLWSIHPKYLDRAGLLALWREALLAQKALEGRTKGYQNHPQLERFKKARNPVKAVGAYLTSVYEESLKRGYLFDRKKIRHFKKEVQKEIAITSGQIEYEIKHLQSKLIKRDKERLKNIKGLKRLQPHPLFRLIKGSVEPWERIQS